MKKKKMGLWLCVRSKVKGQKNIGKKRGGIGLEVISGEGLKFKGQKLEGQRSKVKKTLVKNEGVLD